MNEINKNEMKTKMPKPLLVVAIIYICLCVFSLTVGIYFCCTANSLDGIAKEILVSIEKGLGETFNTSIEISENVAMIVGIGTTIVGVIQGISGIGLITRKKGFRYFTIGFTIFSFLNCVSKMFIIAPTLFGIGKTIIYIFMMWALFSKRTKDWYQSEK